MLASISKIGLLTIVLALSSGCVSAPGARGGDTTAEQSPIGNQFGVFPKTQKNDANNNITYRTKHGDKAVEVEMSRMRIRNFQCR